MVDTVSALTFLGEPPQRMFLDGAELLPMRNVALLNGDGGVGKSLLAMQLAIAVASGTMWIGMEVVTGTVLFVSAEDDQEEIHNRFHEICRAEGVEKAQCAGLEFVMLAGRDAVLATEDKRSTKMTVTKLYNELDELIAKLTPVVVILDNLADIFSGNENNRVLAKQFIGMLRGLAIRHDTLILILAHPSLAGLSSGSGGSGSTAWNNSVRSRLYLHRVVNGDGHTEEDETIRELETKKANYSAKGQPITLKWQGGRFERVTAPKLFDGVPGDIVERVQATLAGRKYRTNQVSPQWAGYKIAELLDLDAGFGIAAKDCTADQKNARQRVGKMLSLWVTNKVISVVKAPDEHREQRTFYDAAAPAKS